MPQQVGSQLGPYTIVAPIGSGGMGEVYRARDGRLNRDVAVKVLPAEVTADPERLQRFETEARATAALSHPNILAVFDLGWQDKRPYVVTELLEGETLRERLQRGALPPRKAVEYAVQIARGLAAAHDKRIVHRDLKPENLFVTREGGIKILDFGLAKLTAPAAALAESSSRSFGAMSGLPTTSPATAAGVVLGTVGYMAPEQVHGAVADHRADIFALGTVLYEMLSGERAFSGASPVDTMSAILHEELREVTTPHNSMPPALDRIVRRCVEKNPDDRFQSARDLAFALDALSGSNVSTTGIPSPPRGHRWLRSAAIAALVVAAIAIAGVAGRLTAPAPASGEVRFESKTFDPQAIFNARFMPDGETVVFSAALEGSSPELYVSRPGAVAPQPLGQRATHLLSISSTGELAVLTDASFIGHRLFRGTLARMPLDGSPRAWMENVREADWSPDGSTIALIRDTGLKDQLEYPIGTVLHESNGYLSDVRVSPDGESVAFFEHPVRYDDRGWLKVVDGSGTVKTLTGEYWGAEGIAWTADGQTIAYAASENGWDSFYPRGVNLSGAPAPGAALPGIALFLMDVSKDGHRLVTRNDDARSFRARLPGESDEREFPWLGAIGGTGTDVSPDGRFVLFSDESQSAGTTYAVSIRRTDGTGVVRLGDGDPAALSPDATRVLASTIGPNRHVVIYPIGPGEPLHLPLGPLETANARLWLPDGRRVVLCGNEPAGPFRCYQQDLAGGLPRALTPENFDVAAVSPGGETFALIAADRTKHLFSIGDRAARPLPGVTAADEVIAWSSDAQSVFVQQRPSISARLERVDVGTGRRTLVRETSLPDRTGLLRVLINSVRNDGDAYTYSYWSRVARLFVVKPAP